MSNPARTLHSRYVEWQARLANGDLPMQAVVEAGSRETVEAARALVRVDELLRHLEMDGMNVAVYRRQYPQWWHGLLSYQAGWHQNMTAPQIMTPSQMDTLEGLANYLDGKVYDIPDASVTNLRDLSQATRATLEGDVDLSRHLQQYLHRLLQEMQNALDDDAVGASYDFAEAVERLYMAFGAAESERTAGTSRWATLKGWIVSTGTAAALEAGSIIVQKAIGM